MMRLRVIAVMALGAPFASAACAPPQGTASAGTGTGAGSSGTGTSTGDVLPQPWMLGWFSSLSPDAHIFDDNVQLFEIRANGTALVRLQGGCGGAEPVDFQKIWKVQDEGSLVLLSPEGGADELGVDAWVIWRFGCNLHQLQQLREGAEIRQQEVFAGRLCMVRGTPMEGCIGTDCTACYKSWCEGEEPTPCEGE